MFATDANLYVPDGAVARYADSEGLGYMCATIKPLSQAGEMTIVATEVQAAKDDLDDYNAGL